MVVGSRAGNSSGVELLVACDGNVRRFSHKTSRKLRKLAHFHCFFLCCSAVFMCGPCASVPHLASSQTSTDVSSGFVGSHSIEGAPGSGAAFSLPLGSVWSAQHSPVSPFLPQPPGPSLRQNYKGPPTAGSSLCPPAPARFFLLSNPPNPRRPPPRPASIRRRYSIHRRRALITKQDYGPSLGTTC